MESTWVVPSGVTHCTRCKVVHTNPDHGNINDIFQNTMCAK